MEYKWNNVGFKADANKVGKELEKIESKGMLTREVVLEYGKNEKSELHKCFEWNDKIAGEKYRLQQASFVLVSLNVVISDEKDTQKTTRMYVNIKNKELKEYKNIVSVLNNDEEYKQLLNNAERDFVSYKEKYNDLIKLQDLKNIIYKNI